jgi:protein-S-isoprenylcysteine O-methyltransferase Ste14
VRRRSLSPAAGEPARPNPGSLARRLAGVLAFDVLFAAFLFVPAGTLAWTRGWILLAVLLAIRVWGTIAVFRAQPELLAERSKPMIQEGQPAADRVLLLAYMASYAALVAFSSADATRLHLFGTPPPALAGLGLALFAGGLVLVALALRENAFAVAVVRHQAERGHAVVSTGPYRLVRHPLYAGLAVLMAGMAMWLGSWAGAVASLVPTGILAWRIVLEERFLSLHLAGYAEYAVRVRSRLVPGIW